MRVIFGADLHGSATAGQKRVIFGADLHGSATAGQKRVIFGADLHGSATAGQKLIDAVEREGADLLVLCGDIYYHGPRNPLPGGHAPMELAEILNKRADIIRCVRGNCDSHVDATISKFKFEENIDFRVNEQQVFVTHGHQINKNNRPSFSYDIMVYGHFHICAIERIDGILYASPGSASLPKGNSKPAYLLLTPTHLTLKSLDGELITSRPLYE